MYAKIIKVRIEKGGVLHVVDRELPPGDADMVVLTRETDVEGSLQNMKKIPIGGYRAGWLAPHKLRRESIYEDA